MPWKQCSKYHMEFIKDGYTKAHMCWSDAKDHVLLFIGKGSPQRFDTPQEAMEFYKCASS